MKFDLTLATVLVFFVPGGLLLLGMPADVISAVDQWKIITKPATGTDAGILLAAIFFCGAVIDSLRTITVQPLVKWNAKCLGSSFPDNYLGLINKDSIVVFELINEKAYAYLRLNQNLTLSFFSLFVLFFITCIIHHNYFIFAPPLILTVIWYAISVSSRRDLHNALNGFVSAHKKP